jgi:putative redox protein
MDAFEVNLSGEQTDDTPRVFKKITMEYVIYGRDIPANELEQTIQLVHEKYCGVAAMLKPMVEISYTYRIVPA